MKEHPLKIKLQKKGLKVRNLALHLGVTEQTIYLWFNGKSKVPPKHFKEIQAYFNHEITLKELRPDVF